MPTLTLTCPCGASLQANASDDEVGSLYFQWKYEHREHTKSKENKG